MTIKSLITTAIFSCFLLVTITTPASMRNAGQGELTMHNNIIAPTAYNQKTKLINCAQYTQKTFSFSPRHGTLVEPEEFEFGHEKFYSIIHSHGLISLHWKGVWTYFKPDGKKYRSAVYGTEVMFKDSNTKYGIFQNKYCKGSYRTTWSAKKYNQATYI